MSEEQDVTGGGAGTCDRCGSELEPGLEFCAKCGSPVGGADAAELQQTGTAGEAAGEGQSTVAGAAGRDGRDGDDGDAERPKKRKLPRPPVEPWAVKAGETVKRIPTWIKVGVPLVILLIIGVIVALLLVAGAHSPAATVDSYLSRLQKGDYQGAYDLTVNKGGRYSTFAYFQRWQNLQAERLGQLKDFHVQPRKEQNKIFGRLVLEEQAAGAPFVASLVYTEKSYDVNMTAEDAGGTWPFKQYRLSLSDRSTRILASPLGAKVTIDGTPAGLSEPDQALQDALSLSHFPKSVNDAVDYVKRLRSAIEGYVESVKRIITGLGSVEQDVQNTFNKFGQSGVSWSQFLDSLKSTADVGRAVGDEVARTIVHLYWTFGGGDDGSLRASLTRTEPDIEVQNLPEGWHEVKVELNGARAQTKEFSAPEGISVDLNPTLATTNALKAAVEGYYAAKSVAEFTLNNSGLPAVIGGTLLDEENAIVLGLASKGQRVASQLISVKYSNPTLLSRNVATIETDEVWNFTTYQGATPTSVVASVKQHATYTLERDRDNTWKVIERKQKT